MERSLEPGDVLKPIPNSFLSFLPLLEFYLLIVCDYREYVSESAILFSAHWTWFLFSSILFHFISFIFFVAVVYSVQ